MKWSWCVGWVVVWLFFKWYRRNYCCWLVGGCSWNYCSFSIVKSLIGWMHRWIYIEMCDFDCRRDKGQFRNIFSFNQFHLGQKLMVIGMNEWFLTFELNSKSVFVKIYFFEIYRYTFFLVKNLRCCCCYYCCCYSWSNSSFSPILRHSWFHLRLHLVLNVSFHVHV